MLIKSFLPLVFCVFANFSIFPFAIRTDEFVLRVFMCSLVRSQLCFFVELLAAYIANVDFRLTVLLLSVFFKYSRAWEESVANFAVGVLCMIPVYVLSQQLFSIKLHSAFITEVVCLNIRMVCPFVFVDCVNVLLQGTIGIGFSFAVGTLFCVKNAFYSSFQTFVGVHVAPMYP